MKKLICLSLFSLLILGIYGCSYRLGDFTVLSTKNVELGAKYEKIDTGEASDEVFVLYVPLGSPNMENAVDKILDEKKGDLLTNAVVSYYYYAFFIGVTGYTVKGDVWRQASLTKIDDSKEYYQLSQKGNDLFLVSCNDPSIILKVEKRSE